MNEDDIWIPEEEWYSEVPRWWWDRGWAAEARHNLRLSLKRNDLHELRHYRRWMYKLRKRKQMTGEIAKLKRRAFRMALVAWLVTVLCIFLTLATSQHGDHGFIYLFGAFSLFFAMIAGLCMGVREGLSYVEQNSNSGRHDAN